ncbi:MAG TPA: IclR family transcriptional regulator [Hyphomicrobiales bacterium]|nr:IclR family transcriptional regulator [Hyphomicrobiales bacterium]
MRQRATATAEAGTVSPLRRRGEDESIDERYMIPGLSRGLALLQLFTRDRPEQRLSEIADGLGLSRSATYRLAYTLEKDGFLYRDPVSRSFSLTSKVLSLGFAFLHDQPLTDLAQPFLRAASDAARSASHLVVLERWEAVYLARVSPQVALVSNIPVGTRLPAHVAASGRALLAGLDDQHLRAIYGLLQGECRTVAVPPTFEKFRAATAADRRRGYVYQASRFNPSLVSFACAVRNRTGAVVAAINVVIPETLADEAGGEAALRAIMLDASAGLSRRLGYGEGRV